MSIKFTSKVLRKIQHAKLQFIGCRLLLLLPRYCVLKDMLAVVCEVNGVWHARASLGSRNYLYRIAFSRSRTSLLHGAVIDPLHGKKINSIVGCAYTVDALIVRNFREKHWENILQRGNTIHLREAPSLRKRDISPGSSICKLYH